MKMPLISVIVPVYNVEKYFSECLESIKKQTFRDFELILVDDGSTDSSGTLCDSFAAEHEYAKVLHQENMGLSEARNQGVKISSGDYVTFIDSDDLVVPNYLEYLYNLVQKYGTEVSVGCARLFWNDECPSTPEPEGSDRLLTAEEMLEGICYARLPIFACGKLYKRYLVEQFPYPKGELYEDTATTHKIIGAIDKVAYGTQKIYYWRQRSGSITHSVITERHYYGITASINQLNYMKEHYPKVVPAAKVRCVMKIIDLTYRLVVGKMDRALFDRMRNAMLPLYASVVKNKKVSISLRVRTIALRCGYIPYVLLSKIYSVVKKNAK